MFRNCDFVQNFKSKERLNDSFETLYFLRVTKIGASLFKWPQLPCTSRKCSEKGLSWSTNYRETFFDFISKSLGRRVDEI